MGFFVCINLTTVIMESKILSVIKILFTLLTYKERVDLTCELTTLIGQSKSLKGYKLVKEYPGSPILGTFEQYTTGRLSAYPEFWQPIYK